MTVAILIPCYNEELTIEKVVSDFRRELPEAKIYVYDNNSSDKTSEKARAVGAHVCREHRQGKGYVVQKMFAEIDADIYVMADGDDTYPASCVKELIKPIADGSADMVVGDRLSTTYHAQNKRRFHSMGNNLVRGMINNLFRAKLHDIMSGYRAFNRYAVKNIPLSGGGFEIETQLTLNALDKGFTVREVPVQYRDRPEGSVSKLNTVRDGVRVLLEIVSIFKDYRPMSFFGFFALLFVFFSIGAGSFPIIEYFQTRVVTHVPLALLATGFAILGSLSLVCALVLNSMRRANHEAYALRLLDYISSVKEKEE